MFFLILFKISIMLGRKAAILKKMAGKNRIKELFFNFICVSIRHPAASDG